MDSSPVLRKAEKEDFEGECRMMNGEGVEVLSNRRMQVRTTKQEISQLTQDHQSLQKKLK